MSFAYFSWRSVLFAGLALGLVAEASAQGGGGRERPRYVLQALDLDHDGTLSAAEIDAAPASLRALDRNGDGQLTADEMEPQRQDAGASPDELVKQMMGFDRDGKGYLVPGDLPERMRTLFARADADHDVRLTPEEIRASVKHTGSPNGRAGAPGSASGIMRTDPVLNALDSNHDGVISADEIAAAAASLRVLDVNHDGSITPDEMRVRQQTPAERAAHVLEENDTNKDGKLSADEIPEGMRARFAEADTNHDGFLDLGELTQMMATMPARQAPGPGPNAQPGGQPKGDHQ